MLKQIFSFIGLIIFVFAIRSSFFEPYKIPSGSMIPTLVIGDYVLVNKFAYGLKVPYTEILKEPIYLTPFKEPQRGDVIIFKAPKDPDKEFIKRVIAIPGDRLEIINKRIYLNDEPLEIVEKDFDPYRQDTKGLERSFPKFEAFEETLNNKKHIVLFDEQNQFMNHMYKIVIPPGYFFAMGDNRDHSSDSRVWGLVPYSHIKGRAMFIWFSLSIPWPWLKMFNLPFSFRPDRIGKNIE